MDVGPEPGRAEVGEEDQDLVVEEARLQLYVLGRAEVLGHLVLVVGFLAVSGFV